MYNKKKTVIVVMMIAVMLMATGYAWFATTLNISTQGNISSMWSVYFSSISEGTAVGTATNAITPNVSGTSATISVNLASPGDSMTYKLTLTNSGNIDAIIEKINAVATGSPAIIYSISGISNGEKLGEGQSKEITLKVEYDANVTSQPAETGKTLTISIVSVQDVGQDVEGGDVEIDQPLLGIPLSSAILSNNTALDGNVYSSSRDAGLYYTSTNTENNGTTYYFSGDVINNFVKIEGIDIKVEAEISGTCIYTGGNINYVTSLNDFHLGTYRAPENVTECTSTNVCKVYTESYTAEPLFYAVGLSEDECTAHNQDLYGEYTSDSATFESDQPDIIGDEGFLWRIVRINEDGSVRLITQDSIGKSSFNVGGTSNAHVGYMYGDGSATTYVGQHANINDSDAKKFLDNWYDEYLSSYSSILADAGFCGDRQLSSGNGTMGEDTYYAATDRLSSSPQFKCTNASNDLYTLISSSKGNKTLTKAIGLITADELKYAGKYIFNGTNFLTMTPAAYLYMYPSPSVYGMDTAGYLTYFGPYEEYVNAIEPTIRPVINVRANTMIKLEGTGEPGTATNPYIISVN